MRPFPAMPGFGVDNAGVGEVEEEFAGGVVDVYKICDETPNGGVYFCSGWFVHFHHMQTILNRSLDDWYEPVSLILVGLKLIRGRFRPSRGI